MRPETFRTRFGSLDPWTRLAAVCWAIVFLAIGIRCAVQPMSRTLYPVYAAAGGDWWAGSDQLYRRTGENGEFDFFRYSPPIAAALVPWHFLPIALGGVVWRLFNATVFLGGAWWWLRSAAPAVLSERRRAGFYLLLIPLSLSSLSNGQVNPLVIGFLLAALAALAEERWWLSAFCVALATSLKLYPLAVGLLLLACYPRQFAGRLLLAVAALAALPFVLQSPAFVLAQYRAWAAALAGDNRWLWPPHMAYRDLWLLLRNWNVSIRPEDYRIVQVIGGAGCAAVCGVLRLRGQTTPHVLSAVLALGSCWMMLLGPATESASYVLLAPALAWSLVAERSAVARGLASSRVVCCFCVSWQGYSRAPGRFTATVYILWARYFSQRPSCGASGTTTKIGRRTTPRGEKM